ncbi:MAG: hypothetical protein IT425_15250 [Pirellulales bacterium]|nr:hypothetical protein [Pirellulales bacterium]
MINSTTVAIGLAFAGIAGICGTAWAGPPLDRPTPPPQCADGRCYANPPLYGCYATRWRRWPVESIDPNAKSPFDAQLLQQQVPPYVPPTPEEEDRRAPPPTIKREDTGSSSGTGETGTAPAPGPGVGPGGEGQPSLPGPAGVPQRQPGEYGPRRVLPPYEPKTPTTTPYNPAAPRSELDAPPTPPIWHAPGLQNSPVRQAERVPAGAAPQPVRGLGPQNRDINSSSDDPPPAPPGNLAASGY